MPLNVSTTGGSKLVITQIAEEGIRDIHVPYAPAAVLPGPTSSVDEDIHREPVIVQTPSPCLLQSYEDVGQAAFGDSGRTFITAVLYTELIGTCALFFILEASRVVLIFVPVLALSYLSTFCSILICLLDNYIMIYYLQGSCSSAVVMRTATEGGR